MKYLAFLALVALPAAALAQPAPKSIADCERVKGDLAYNQCLSMFGPKVGERRSRGVAPADDEDEPVVTRGRRGRSSYARRGGRQRAVFEVGRGRSSLRVSPAWQGRGSRSRRR
jgi:hypothetical protein